MPQCAEMILLCVKMFMLKRKMQTKMQLWFIERAELEKASFLCVCHRATSCDADNDELGLLPKRKAEIV